jgi:hypothetical protein
VTGSKIGVCSPLIRWQTIINWKGYGNKRSLPNLRNYSAILLQEPKNTIYNFCHESDRPDFGHGISGINIRHVSAWCNMFCLHGIIIEKKKPLQTTSSLPCKFVISTRNFSYILWRVCCHRGVRAMLAGCFWHQLAACPGIRDE